MMDRSTNTIMENQNENQLGDHVTNPTFESQGFVHGQKKSADHYDYRQEKTHNYKIFTTTWNVGGMVPQDDMNLEDWLDTRNNTYDIYVIGFQEVVPLNAKNVLGPNKNKVLMKWNRLIGSALNKNTTDLRRSDQEPKSVVISEKQKVFPVKDVNYTRQEYFHCISSKQMVGILVSVWIHGDLRQHVRYQSISCVGCGILGCLGNKGSVSVRFMLHETSFCFVCCHLASGGKERDELHRNSDAVQIFSRNRFPSGPGRGLPSKILDHDQVILLGDLNYRISLPEDKTRSLVERRDWTTLLDNDQLRAEFCEEGTFEGWHEGKITFSPTYKYYPNSDTYYGYINTRKGEKRRSPAWCDRILWQGKRLTQHAYYRSESRMSDHRPVHAVFVAEVDRVRANPNKSLVSFFSYQMKSMVDYVDVGSCWSDDDQIHSNRRRSSAHF